MTISSIGYAGTVNDAQWAKMVSRVGPALMSVDNYSAFRVTAAAGTRTVRVAAGGASAAGIYDVSDAAVNITLGSVASGVRWDLIVLRRTWATKATTIVAIPGGSSKVIPSRNTTPGGVFDQPLALVRVTAGSTVIQEVVDLRVAVATGGAVAWEDLARSYLTELGTVLRIGDVTWSRVTDSGGAAIWVSDDMSDTGWVTVPRGPNWAAVTGYPLQVRRSGQDVRARGAVRANASASLSSLGTVPAGFRPSSITPLGATVASSKAVGEQFINPQGLLYWTEDYRSTTGVGVGHIVMIHGAWFIG